MAERKLWKPQEDNALKYLHQVRGIKKWSIISTLMRTQFNIFNRNGKQCRERYHNHLDQTINKLQWKKEEQNILFTLHNQIGNKWAEIARHLPGRTDNCVKNHLYSKLRKAIRQINKFIYLYGKKQYKEIKINFIYKLIQLVQQKYKKKFSQQAELYEESFELKNKLIKCSEYDLAEIQGDEQINRQVKKVISEMVQFNRVKFKKAKKSKNSRYHKNQSSKIKKRMNKFVSDGESQEYESNQDQNSSVEVKQDLQKQSQPKSHQQILNKKNKDVCQSYWLLTQQQKNGQTKFQYKKPQFSFQKDVYGEIKSQVKKQQESSRIIYLKTKNIEQEDNTNRNDCINNGDTHTNNNNNPSNHINYHNNDMIITNTNNNSKYMHGPATNSDNIDRQFGDQQNYINDKLHISIQMPAFTEYKFLPTNYVMIQTPIMDSEQNNSLISKWGEHDFMNK